MYQYPCNECGDIFYSNIALVNHQCNKNKTIEIDTKTFYHPKKCPKCDKNMYSYLAQKMNLIQSICYFCGFYWSNSSVYESCEMFENMIIRNPFLLNTIIKNPRIHW
jgi:hypothetical protein